ncbi:MAG: hypothetical protein PVF58_12845 [Candidatus Methanofastidiosia archaeon]
MQLEIVEPAGEKCSGDGSGDPCQPGGFWWGCCIIHYWCWEPGVGLCC